MKTIGWLLGALIAVALAIFGVGCGGSHAEPGISFRVFTPAVWPACNSPMETGSTVLAGEEELPVYDGRCGIKGCQPGQCP